MNWIRRLMMGRYGSDALTLALLVLALLLSIIAAAANLTVLSYIGYIPIVLGLLRMFSRNIAARQHENRIFLKYWSIVKEGFFKILRPFKAFFSINKKRLRDIKTYRYFKCQKCKQVLRVPVGKGKITITCPKCHSDFTKRT